MPELERLTRRHQDYLLIETIKRVGASNYSLLARLTGLNPETVRYKVSKQLSRFGLSLSVNINYGELGFTLGILSVRGKPNAGAAWLEKASYLTFVGKVLGAEAYRCLYAIPTRFKKKYAMLLASLKERGLMDDFRISELQWVRYPPFRSEMYDFDARRWVLDWRRIEAPTQEVGVTAFSGKGESRLDEVDVKVMRFLQDDPTLGLARIGKEIGVHPRTVRYHHSEHIVKGRLLLGNNVRWTRPITDGASSQIIQMAFSFRELSPKEISTARTVFNRLPFTWFEAGSEGGGYYPFLDIPISNFHETMGYIEAKTESIGQRHEMTMLDPAKSHYLGLPDQNFDRRLGWRLFGLKGEVEEPQGSEP